MTNVALLVPAGRPGLLTGGTALGAGAGGVGRGRGVIEILGCCSSLAVGDWDALALLAALAAAATAAAFCEQLTAHINIDFF